MIKNASFHETVIIQLVWYFYVNVLYTVSQSDHFDLNLVQFCNKLVRSFICHCCRCEWVPLPSRSVWTDSANPRFKPLKYISEISTAHDTKSLGIVYDSRTHSSDYLSKDQLLLGPFTHRNIAHKQPAIRHSVNFHAVIIIPLYFCCILYMQ